MFRVEVETELNGRWYVSHDETTNHDTEDDAMTAGRELVREGVRVIVLEEKAVLTFENDCSDQDENAESK